MTTEDRAHVAQRAAAALGALLTPRWQPLPHQIPPPGNWYGWLLLAGRGAGKTDACAEYIARHVAGPPCLPGPVPHWVGIIAPTQGDAVTACVSGPSGIKAHDPTASGPITSAGGTVVRWANGSQAKLYGANSPEDVERLRAGGNTCVAEGTLVRTEYGPRPIESIQVGDRVWTRNGLRRVLRVWDNGVKEVRRYEHNSGHVWLTPDHEIWTTRGWIEARFVKPLDTVTTWNNLQSSSCTTGSDGTSGRAATTRTVEGGCSTDGCGDWSEETSRTGCRCTTSTTTVETTGSRTWRSSAGLNTCASTPEIRSGIDRVQKPRGLVLNGVRSRASTVEEWGAHGLPERSSTAQRSAVVLRHEHGRNGCAACADLSSSASPEIRPAPVRGGALRSTPTSSAARVYDLTVEHDHEFFAGDLLVSNCIAWLEEFAAWRYMQESFDQLRFGLRSGPRPHWVASTTPKPKPLLKRLMQGEIANVVTTAATMYDNPHLPAHIREMLEDAYAGTDLGEQELYGRVLDEIKNALWRRKAIAASRMRLDDLPDLIRRTVGVDPSGGAGEQGIVVTAKSGLLLPGLLPAPAPDPDEPAPVGAPRPQPHGFVLDDRSCQLPPEGWGQRAVQAAIDWEAEDIAVEVNYGGDQAIAVIRTAMEKLGVDIPVRKVRATQGKAIRAQPVAALSAQGRWHHAGTFPELEDQLCTWYPELGWSPDRLDGMVWGPWHMKLVGTVTRGQGSLGGDLARKQIVGSRLR